MSIKTQFDDILQQDYHYPSNISPNSHLNHIYRDVQNIKINNINPNIYQKKHPLVHTQSHPYLQKLFHIIHQYQLQIHSNLPILHNLQKQTTIYRKICHKQKQKIQKNTSSSSTYKLLIQDYQRQIQTIYQNKNQLHQILSNTQSQSQEKFQINSQTLSQLTKNQQFLQLNYQKLKEQMKAYQNILKNKEIAKKGLQIKIKDNQKLIKQKQSIERKYEEILKRIKQLEAQQNIIHDSNSSEKYNNTEKIDKHQSQIHKQQINIGLKKLKNDNRKHQSTPLRHSQSNQSRNTFNNQYSIKIRDFDTHKIQEELIQ